MHFVLTFNHQFIVSNSEHPSTIKLFNISDPTPTPRKKTQMKNVFQKNYNNIEEMFIFGIIFLAFLSLPILISLQDNCPLTQEKSSTDKQNTFLLKYCLHI